MFLECNNCETKKKVLITLDCGISIIELISKKKHQIPRRGSLRYNIIFNIILYIYRIIYMRCIYVKFGIHRASNNLMAYTMGFVCVFGRKCFELFDWRRKHARLSYNIYSCFLYIYIYLHDDYLNRHP